MKSAIFEGQVKHRRSTPVPHAFQYRVFMLYLDLAELDDVFRGRWFWSTRRVAPARFRRSDHFGNPDDSLDFCIRQYVENETGNRPDGPIRLLTNLSYFGYCFNPVSFYYCFDNNADRVKTIVAEVNNTPWGERHLYVLPHSAEKTHIDNNTEFTPVKAMHVSPFMPMDIDYRWRFGAPDERISIFMENSRDGEKLFDATLSLTRTEINAATLARVLVSYPLMTLKVVAAIHWQALRLWLKRTPLHPHPAKRKRPLEDRS